MDPHFPFFKGYRFVAHRHLAGVNYGLEQNKIVYVAPSIYSLLMSEDGDKVLRSLRIRKMFSARPALLNAL